MSRTHVVYTPQELLHILHAATASRDLLDVEKYSTLQPFYKNTAQIASGMMDKPVDAPRIKRKIEDQLRKAAMAARRAGSGEGHIEYPELHKCAIELQDMLDAREARQAARRDEKAERHREALMNVYEDEEDEEDGRLDRHTSEMGRHNGAGSSAGLDQQPVKRKRGRKPKSHAMMASGLVPPPAVQQPIMDVATAHALVRDVGELKQHVAEMKLPIMPRGAKRQRVSKNTSAYLLTNPKSKLATRSLDAAFREETWELLSPGRREACLALLPAIDKNESKEGGLCDGFWKGNVFLQEALRDFQSDLAEGRFTPQYRRRVKRAVKQRLEGAADSWKEGQFELFCQQPEEDSK